MSPRKVAAALLLAALALPARGADEPPAPAPAPKAEAPVKLQMQDVEIRGELERPEVFYIIPRRKANLDLGSLRKDYTGSILEPLLPGPFEARYGTRAANPGD